MKRDITNSDVFLWSLHDLGGSTSYVDVEDVYVKCHELAPLRFAWRTKQLPDYKKCAKALRDAEAREPKLLVKTADGLARQLSREGQEWIQANAGWLAESLGVGRIVPAPKQRADSRILRELDRSDVFARWQEVGRVEVQKWEVADLLRCSTDSSVRIWKERIALLRSAAFAVENVEQLKFLDALVQVHGSWFGEGEQQ